jgi:hypothetical protein
VDLDPYFIVSCHNNKYYEKVIFNKYAFEAGSSPSSLNLYGVLI